MLIGVKMLYSKIAKSDYYLLLVCLSVLHTERLGSYRTVFREILILVNCSKDCRGNPIFVKI